MLIMGQNKLERLSLVNIIQPNLIFVTEAIALGAWPNSLAEYRAERKKNKHSSLFRHSITGQWKYWQIYTNIAYFEKLTYKIITLKKYKSFKNTWNEHTLFVKHILLIQPSLWLANCPVSNVSLT